MSRIRRLIDEGYEYKLINFIRANVPYPYSVENITREQFTDDYVKYIINVSSKIDQPIEPYHYFVFTDSNAYSSFKTLIPHIQGERYMTTILLPLFGEEIVAEYKKYREDKKASTCEKFDGETQKMIDWMNHFITANKTEATDE